jgi:hypothetical protein
MKRTLLVALVLVSLIFGIVAYASAASEPVTVHAMVNNVFSLGLVGNSISFDTLTSDPDVEMTAATTPVVSVKSSKLFSLYTSATDFSAAGPLAMDAEKMSYEVSGDAVVAKTVFLNTDQEITPTAVRGERSYTNTISLTPGWDVEPADYTGTITYTALADH